jgi:amino acid transporter
MTQAVRERPAGRIFKRFFFGRPMASDEAPHQLLPKWVALPVFSSDPLSSNAYATEEIMLVLVAAGTMALRHVMPIAFVIATVLVVVVISYRQTVRAYPSGGGAYIVSKENHGELPGLIAAAALLIDYVLTVSVSIVAGVAAITSASEGLLDYRVEMSLGFVALITLMNLRGVRESGVFFAIPTYGFVACVYVMIGIGLVQCLGGCPVAETAHLPIEATQSLTLFVILRAFSSGSTALTGVEAISNGVPAFRRPQSHNAAATLAMMGAMSVTMFIGISFLATRFHVRPLHERTVISQVAETAFGRGLMFFVIQAMTAAILVLAANTAYQDFPRLSSILARDRYMPRQFMNRGDRLVFSNGVLVLAIVASILIVIFDADVTRLIQLYVVGVFTSFTLSQSGMVRHWIRVRGPNWRRSAIINGIGALATGIVLVVVTATKFIHGAYIVVIASPLLVWMFRGINRHYRSVAAQLRAPSDRPRVLARTRAVVLVPQVDTSVMRALGYARALRPVETRALFVGGEAHAADARAAWERRGIRVPLDVASAEGELVDNVRSYIRGIEHEGNEFVTLVVPEKLRAGRLGQFLLQRKELMLKAAMLFEPQVVLTDVPSQDPDGGDAAQGPIAPTRNVAIVLVSAVHNATLRAVEYAQAIRPTELRAVTFNVDEGETRKIIEDWASAGTDVGLEAIDSPYREVTRPLVQLIHRIRRASPDTVVTVIVPEFVVKKWWHQFLHNQTALAIKAALLFEPGVVVTSVPYHLD